MNRSRLSAGVYVAETPCVVSLIGPDGAEREYSEYRAGEQITIPGHVNGFWRALVWSDLAGHAKPRVRPV